MNSTAFNLKITDNEFLCANIHEWRSKTYVDFRIWSKMGSNSEIRPTGKGFFVPLSQLSDFSNLVSQMTASVQAAK